MKYAHETSYITVKSIVLNYDLLYFLFLDVSGSNS